MGNIIKYQGYGMKVLLLGFPELMAKSGMSMISFFVRFIFLGIKLTNYKLFLGCEV